MAGDKPFEHQWDVIYTSIREDLHRLLDTLPNEAMYAARAGLERAQMEWQMSAWKQNNE